MKQPLNFKAIYPNNDNGITNKRIVILLLLVLIGAVLIMLLGSMLNNKPEYILPPQPDLENQPYQMVIEFIQTDDTNEMPYEDGFNCLDATLRLWRNASWEGLAAIPVMITYEEPPNHMIIAFWTIDKGNIFIEPQNDKQVILNVNEFYNGRRIKGYYYMSVNWIALGPSPEYDEEK